MGGQSEALQLEVCSRVQDELEKHKGHASVSEVLSVAQSFITVRCEHVSCTVQLQSIVATMLQDTLPQLAQQVQGNPQAAQHTLGPLWYLLEAVRACMLPRLVSLDPAMGVAPAGNENLPSSKLDDSVRAQLVTSAQATTTTLTSAVMSLSQNLADTEAESTVRQWLDTLIQLATGATDIAHLPEPPPAMRVYLIINSTWKEIMRLLSALPTSMRPALHVSYQHAFEIVWHEFMVRPSASVGQSSIQALCV